jgi:hypothetical protein
MPFNRVQPSQCKFRAVAELATAFPGNTGLRPQTITTMAEGIKDEWI